jgi:hypothetical protein
MGCSEVSIPRCYALLASFWLLDTQKSAEDEEMGYFENCHPGREWLLLSGSLKMEAEKWMVCSEIRANGCDVLLASSCSLRELEVNSGQVHISFQNPLERSHGLLLSFCCLWELGIGS